MTKNSLQRTVFADDKAWITQHSHQNYPFYFLSSLFIILQITTIQSIDSSTFLNYCNISLQTLTTACTKPFAKDKQQPSRIIVIIKSRSAKAFPLQTPIPKPIPANVDDDGYRCITSRLHSSTGGRQR